MKREKDEAQVPLTDAEAGAIQAVSEVERLLRELAAMRELWAHVCWRLGVPDGTDKQGALDTAIDALKPSGRVFTEAEVRDLLRAKLKATDEYIAMREQSGDREAGGAYSVRTSLVNLAKDLGLALD